MVNTKKAIATLAFLCALAFIPVCFAEEQSEFTIEKTGLNIYVNPGIYCYPGPYCGPYCGPYYGPWRPYPGPSPYYYYYRGPWVGPGPCCPYW